MSEERRRGYGWQGGFGVSEAITYYQRVTATSRDAWLAKNASPFAAKSTSARPTSRSAPAAKKIAPEIRRLLDLLKPNGFWVTNRSAKLVDSLQTEWIETEVFIRNVTALCAYLESTSAPSGGSAHSVPQSERTSSRAWQSIDFPDAGFFENTRRPREFPGSVPDSVALPPPTVVTARKKAAPTKSGRQAGREVAGLGPIRNRTSPSGQTAADR